MAGIFYFLASYGFLVIIAAVFLIRETYPAELRRQTTSTAGQRYRAVFADRIFVGMLLVGGFNFGGLFAYLSASTFLFQQVYNFSPQEYGRCSASTPWHRRRRPNQLQGHQASGTPMDHGIRHGLDVADGPFDCGVRSARFGLWGVMVPLWFYILATGFMFPCVQVIALANHGAQAGTAASLLGASNFLMAGIIPPVVGWLGVSSAVPMGPSRQCVSQAPCRPSGSSCGRGPSRPSTDAPVH
ncbi:hypothetical protein GCM10017710_49160 [Arthrobacter ramosus]